MTLADRRFINPENNRTSMGDEKAYVKTSMMIQYIAQYLIIHPEENYTQSQLTKILNGNPYTNIESGSALTTLYDHITKKNNSELQKDSPGSIISELEELTKKYDSKTISASYAYGMLNGLDEKFTHAALTDYFNKMETLDQKYKTEKLSPEQTNIDRYGLNEEFAKTADKFSQLHGDLEVRLEEKMESEH